MIGQTRQQRTGTALTIVALVLIALATLRPAPETAIEPRWTCLVCGPTGLTDVILNVVLFLPFGAGLAMTRTRWRVAIPLIIATTFAIELLQYRVIVGRDGTLSDVIANSIGGIAGFVAAERWRWWLAGTARTSGALAMTALGAWVATLSVSASALQVTAELHGSTAHLAPVMPPFPHFSGLILSASLDGLPLDNREVVRPVRGWSRSHLLEASIGSNERVTGPSPIVWIGRGIAEHMSLAQYGTALFGRVRLRASDWKLIVPSIEMPDAFAGIEPAPPRAAATRIWTRVRTGEATVGVSSPNVTDSVTVELGPTLGWALLVPFGRSVGPSYRWLSALWLSGLLVPVGFWSGQLAAPGVRRYVLLAAVAMSCSVLALPLIRWSVGAPTTPWWEWAAMIVGLTAGVVAGVAASRLQHARHP